MSGPPIPSHDFRRGGGPRPPSLRAAEEVLPEYTPRLQLGAGSFGRVFLMEHRQTRARVAVKTLKKERIMELGMEEKVRREIAILLRLRHPNVIRLYDVRETPRYILLVMEYAQNGELFEYITERGRLTESEARRIFQQIVAGVEACHRRMVVHRDLKPENILLDHQWTVKVADFGLGNLMREGHFLKTSCGSPNYAAPEVISGRFYCGPEVDVWGCGVVLYTLLCGRLPFDEKSHGALYQKIKVAAYPRPSHVSFPAQDLLTRMLVVDPTMRATIPEIKRHPWFLPWFIPQELLQLQAQQGSQQQQGSLGPEAGSQPGAEWAQAEGAGLGTPRGWAAAEPAGAAAAPSLPMAEDKGGHAAPLGGPSSPSPSASPPRPSYGTGPSTAPWAEDGQLQHRIWGQARWAPGAAIGVPHSSWWEAMMQVCLALQHLGVRWKKQGPYLLKCYRPWRALQQEVEAAGRLQEGSGVRWRKRPAWREDSAEVALSELDSRNGAGTQLGAGPSSIFPEQAGGSLSQNGDLQSAGPGAHNIQGARGRVHALSTGGELGAQVDSGLWFEIQLYRGQGGECLVDLCFIGGASPFYFFDFCTEFRTIIAER